jgi:hypothetical protein
MGNISQKNIGEKYHRCFGAGLIGLMVFLGAAVSAEAHDVKCNTSKDLIDAERSQNVQMDAGVKQTAHSATPAGQVEPRPAEADFSANNLPDRLVQDEKEAEGRSTVLGNLERRKTGDVDAALSDEGGPDNTWGSWRWEGKDE